MLRLLLAALVILTAGCDHPLSPGKINNLTEADQRLIAIVKDALKIEPVVKSYANTRWIYIPVTFDFFKVQAGDEPAQTSAEPKISSSLRYLDVNFDNRRFHIAYDVGETLSYPKSLGYVNTYTSEYQSAQRTLIGAIPRAYADLPNIPDFFVIVFANIETGLEIRIVAHSKDLIRGNFDPSFSEEFAKRLIQKQPIGSKAIINDFSGKYLDDHDLTWPEFLAEQIRYRIEFKYSHSSLPPNADPLKEMLAQAQETLRAYGFDKYDDVQLEDKRKGETKNFKNSLF